jgi:hypothetical protein
LDVLEKSVATFDDTKRATFYDVKSLLASHDDAKSVCMLWMSWKVFYDEEETVCSDGAYHFGVAGVFERVGL